LAERIGAIAADTAALVPSFNASRRFILLFIAFLAEPYHCSTRSVVAGL
jgi:hypothetical protein